MFVDIQGECKECTLKSLFILLAFIYIVFLSSCGMTRPPEISRAHIHNEPLPVAGNIPRPVPPAPLLPPPGKRPKLETYTIVVSNVPVRELLFSIARDAKINLDLHDDIKGRVSINAIDQTLPQILSRLAEQINIRYEIRDDYLLVREDRPYFKSYKVDYVNMERSSSSRVRVATTLGSTGSNDIGARGGSLSKSKGTSQDNSSLTEIKNTSINNFWQTLTRNITSLTGEKTKAAKDNSSNVIINREGGIILVKAKEKQHKRIQKFINQITRNARRQVLIEATIAEIKLSDRYQAGVDWSLINSNGNTDISLNTDFRGASLGQSPFTALSMENINGARQLSLTLRALEKFGDVKVLSSPKVMAINNQPAILKVVDNFVYFELDVDSAINTNVAITTFDTKIKAVPVGFVMSVTPYINEDNVVTLNIRPTISRIIDTVEDPNPEFKRANISSRVPVIQVREIESILQVNSGDTAIIGGLMQDTINEETTGVPFLSSIPLFGSLFSYRDDLHEKSELIIFIRPIVVTQNNFNKLKENLSLNNFSLGK